MHPCFVMRLCRRDIFELSFDYLFDYLLTIFVFISVVLWYCFRLSWSYSVRGP